MDEGWYVGRLKEVPGVFSQGETLEALQENIRDAHHLMVEETVLVPRRDARIMEIKKTGLGIQEVRRGLRCIAESVLFSWIPGFLRGKNFFVLLGLKCETEILQYSFVI